ncbi:MAG: MBL fold metallo-hydrolase [Bacteroidales bacterium]|nr:MBL fold metallo-hydrolase [Bacteroidales bacterium]
MPNLKIARFGFSLFGINTYVVYSPDSKECAIIDPGMINDEERKAIDNFIEKNGLKVKYLINTHLHIDHCIGNSYIEKKYGVKGMAHPADLMLGSILSSQAQMFGLPFKVDDITDVNELKEGDVISLGNGKLNVIHVPGHAPGHIALYDKEDKFLIDGDILFEGSIGRTDLPGGNYQNLAYGIVNKLFTLPDDVTVFPGHGSQTTIGREKESNPYV